MDSRQDFAVVERPIADALAVCARLETRLEKRGAQLRDAALGAQRAALSRGDAATARAMQEVFLAAADTSLPK